MFFFFLGTVYYIDLIFKDFLINHLCPAHLDEKDQWFFIKFLQFVTWLKVISGCSCLVESTVFVYISQVIIWSILLSLRVVIKQPGRSLLHSFLSSSLHLQSLSNQGDVTDTEEEKVFIYH